MLIFLVGVVFFFRFTFLFLSHILSLCCFDNNNSWNKNKKKFQRKDMMGLVSALTLPWPPPLLFFSSFHQAHNLSSINKDCVIHTLVLLPVLLGVREFRATQGLLPVLIVSTRRESKFTGLLCSLATCLSSACGTGRPQYEKPVVLCCRPQSWSWNAWFSPAMLACCSPSGHDPTWGNTWL